MKSTLFFLGILPVAAAVVAGLRFGFRVLSTVTASIAGELLGLFLYAAYNRWPLAAVLSGKASGALNYVGTDAPRQRLIGFLMFCGWGALMGIFVLFVQRLYTRLRSARRGPVNVPFRS